MRALVLAALVLVLAAPSAGAAAEAPAPKERHCSLTILGQNSDGSLRTSALTCSSDRTSLQAASGGTMAMSSVIAVHYTNFNLTGSTLSIQGTTCGGGWLNFPAGWTNAIASTSSGCWVDHYTGPGLTGSVDWTYGMVRQNLTAYPWAADSARYS